MTVGAAPRGELGKDLESVAAWHHQVQQHQVDVGSRQLLERVQPVPAGTTVWPSADSDRVRNVRTRSSSSTTINVLIAAPLRSSPQGFSSTPRDESCIAGSGLRTSIMRRGPGGKQVSRRE